MDKKKLDQLRKVFKTVLKDAISNARLRQPYFGADDYLQRIVDSLVYEVKIRATERKE